MIRRLALGALAALFVLHCGGGTEHHTYAEYGATLAHSAATANSRYNQFACTTCHAERASMAGTTIYPGAPLEGASARPSWWGGNVLDLEVAVDTCFTHFMQGEHLDPNGDTGQALLAYLDDLTATAPAAQTAAVPFTVPPGATDLTPGDATRGADVYQRACANCHGPIHGPVTFAEASVVPDDTLNAHLGQYGPGCTRVVFVEKIRHGSFYGIAGRMPPFSEEVLSDAQIADILAYLQVPTTGTCP